MLSSHILGQVQSVCDRVGFFSAGRLVASGRLEDLAAAAGGGRPVFEIGADGDGDDIERVLRGIDGVQSVERLTGDRRTWAVSATSDVAAALTSALAASSHPVVHLRRRGDDLLEIYRQLVPEERDGRRIH